MAFSNTLDTTSPGSAALNREDLHDAISLLAPSETPVLSSAQRFTANATIVDWGVDKLDAPNTAGEFEGTDVSDFDDKFENVARLSNYVMKKRRAFRVSDWQQKASSAGPQDFARAEIKATKELKRDVEAVLLGNQDRDLGSGSTPPTARGFGDWLDSAGPSDVPAPYRTPATSIHASGSFNETVLNNLITSIYRVNGQSNKLTLVADTALRRVITDFHRADSASGAIRSVNSNADDGFIKLAVSMYESDHGIISIVNMNPDCAPDTTNKDTGYILNPDYYAVGEFIPMGSVRLDDQGGGPRGFVDYSFTLKVGHPGAHGKITAIS